MDKSLFRSARKIYGNPVISYLNINISETNKLSFFDLHLDINMQLVRDPSGVIGFYNGPTACPYQNATQKKKSYFLIKSVSMVASHTIINLYLTL